MIITEDKKDAPVPTHEPAPSSVVSGSSEPLAGPSQPQPSPLLAPLHSSSPPSITPGDPHYENPPEYTPSPMGGVVTTSTIAGPASNYGNHFIIKRDIGKIKGTFMIDPSLVVPAALLPDRHGEGTHPHLEARTELGPVEVDIHIQNKSPFSGRAQVLLISQIGNVTIRLREVSVPFTLKASTEIGAVRLMIPRTFRGMISQSTEIGKNTLSPDVQVVATARSHIRGRRRVFVGDLQGPGWEDEGATWTGDEIALHSEVGGIHVAFMDEPEDGKSGFSRFASSLF